MNVTDKQKKFTLISAIIVVLFGALSAVAIWQLADREEVINEPEVIELEMEWSPKQWSPQ